MNISRWTRNLMSSRVVALSLGGWVGAANLPLVDLEAATLPEGGGTAWPNTGLLGGGFKGGGAPQVTSVDGVPAVRMPRCSRLLPCHQSRGAGPGLRHRAGRCAGGVQNPQQRRATRRQEPLRGVELMPPAGRGISNFFTPGSGFLQRSTWCRCIPESHCQQPS